MKKNVIISCLIILVGVVTLGSFAYSTARIDAKEKRAQEQAFQSVEKLASTTSKGAKVLPEDSKNEGPIFLLKSDVDIMHRGDVITFMIIPVKDFELKKLPSDPLGIGDGLLKPVSSAIIENVGYYSYYLPFQYDGSIEFAVNANVLENEMGANPNSNEVVIFFE